MTDQIELRTSVLARCVSLKELLESGVFEDDPHELDAGFVRETLIVRDNYDNRVEAYSISGKLDDHYLSYSNGGSGEVDPDEQCFIVYAVLEPFRP